MTGQAPTRWRPLVAVVTGPTATIVNTPPLGVDPDALHPQRLTADLNADAESGSAHPLLPSTGGTAGSRVPAGRLHPLPYRGEADAESQTFLPSAERLFEEIDTLELDEDGRTRVLGRLADFAFHRAGAPGGYEAEGERPGVDFFPYGETSRRAEPGFDALLRITNTVQEIADGPADAVQWLEGTPVIEETLYWLSLLVDTDKPIVGQVAQRLHRAIGSDGPRNLLDGLGYVVSRAWADAAGADAVGPVLVTDGVVLAARDVVKSAGRPGGYTAGAYGPVAVIGPIDRQRVEYRPTRRTTSASDLRLPALPASVPGLHGPVRIADGDRRLAPAIAAAVEIVKYGRYGDAELEASLVDSRLRALGDRCDLAGFVLEGLAQNGWATQALEGGLRRAVYSGLPVVWTGRGVPAAPAGLPPAPFVSADGLPAQKARMLLLAALLREGAAPVAADPDAPTAHEQAATRDYTARLQQLFDTH